MIDVRAEVCPHCRTAFTVAEVDARIKAANVANKAGLGGCLLFVLVVGGCTWLTGSESTPDVPERPAATAKADAVAFYRKTMSIVSQCDRAGQRVATAAKADDAVALYQAADSMESACLSTPSDIRAIDVPATVGQKAYAKLTEARSACESAYLNRWSAAGALKKALDDRGSVSRLAELRETTSMITAGTIVCVAGLIGEAKTLGATDAELGGSI